LVALRLDELARLLGARLEGDTALEVARVATIRDAGPGDLTFLGHPRYGRLLADTAATAALVAEDHRAPAREGLALLHVKDPYLALARALDLLHPEARPEEGVHPAASIHSEAVCGTGLIAFPGSCVDAGAVLGERVILHPGAVVGAACRLGDDVVLHPNVVLYPSTVLGNRVTVHAGAVLGSDGFGYAQGPEGLVKVPQVGRVVVEDDVEIGANVAIDRGSLGETRIGAGTKIDNLVQIGHNVRVGSHCLLVGQSGISGSTTLGDGVVIAGQSGAAGHLKLGDGARVAAKSAVFQDLEKGATVAGVPAMDIGLWRRTVAAHARLPEALKRLRRLERGRDATTPDEERR